FGWLVNENDPPHWRAPEDALENASVGLSGISCQPRSTLTGAAFWAAILLAPLLYGTRAWKPFLFFLVCGSAAWFQMAITKNAGGSAHHTVLLWPCPQILIALASSQLCTRDWIGKRVARWCGCVLVAVLATSNILVVNEYYSHAIRNGPGINFTDAI